MAPVITQAELLDALAAAATGTGPTNARTVRELQKDTGLSVRKVRLALLLCKEEGRLSVYQVKREGIDGRASAVTAYAIAPKKRT